jgi:hypothetical protein
MPNPANAVAAAAADARKILRIVYLPVDDYSRGHDQALIDVNPR